MKYCSIAFAEIIENALAYERKRNARAMIGIFMEEAEMERKKSRENYILSKYFSVRNVTEKC